ncbi:MAG: hypothetical protein HC888_00500 [Candidatus Competibacteraceae bacterium]|nr:hypothetical protein [Candidatus Competibacteraceae bacterium]
MRLTTFKDMINHTITYLGKDASRASAADAREAVLDAYRDIGTMRDWAYWRKAYRLVCSAPYSTGTIEYDHTGGTYERQLTLTGGTWPDWALYGFIRIGNINYEVEERKTSTVLTLRSNTNPGEDVAAGTTYRISRDRYTLPSDFLSIKELAWGDGLGGPCFVNATDWIEQRARSATGPGRPVTYSVIGDENVFGSMNVCFWPDPDQAYTVDILYASTGREMIISDYTEGKVTSISGSTTITGTGTVFESDMVGSVIRLSTTTSDDSDEITNVDGINPYVMERTILEVVSETEIRIDSAANRSLSEVNYVISDPVDIEPNSMLRLLKRACEKQIRIKTRLRVLPEEDVEYDRALQLAMAADSRFTGIRYASAPYIRRRRLRDYPATQE